MELLLQVRSASELDTVADMLTNGPTPISRFTKIKLAFLQKQLLHNNFKGGCLVDSAV
jgi:hypothetical protein